jgi:hypothetical protein
LGYREDAFGCRHKALGYTHNVLGYKHLGTVPNFLLYDYDAKALGYRQWAFSIVAKHGALILN